MSINITTAFVEQYRANVMHLAQQQGSRLRRAVRTESVTGKNAFFEQIGAVSARRRLSRHSDTPRMDTPHARRRVSLFDYDWADLVDDLDKVRMLIDPASDYAKAAANAMNRAIDDEIIAAAIGVAYTGVDGSTQTAYDTNNTIAVNVIDAGSTAGDVGLNVAKLLAAKKTLDAAEVEAETPRFIACNAAQIQSMLKATRVTSADYNTVKALAQGEVNSFCGFEFIRTERIPNDANSDNQCIYWAQNGITLALGAEPTAKITERDDKNYATQVFYSMAIGATRMEECRVGIILCDPTVGPGDHA